MDDLSNFQFDCQGTLLTDVAMFPDNQTGNKKNSPQKSVCFKKIRDIPNVSKFIFLDLLAVANFGGQFV